METIGCIALCVVSAIIIFGVFFVESTYKNEPIWYVRYPDGHRTYSMPLKDAESYQAIFGGTIYKSTLIK